MIRTCHHLPSRQVEALKARSLQTGLSASELLRRMIDYCQQEFALNDIVPALSGQFSEELRPPCRDSGNCSSTARS